MIVTLIIIACLIVLFGTMIILTISKIGKPLSPPPASMDVTLKNLNLFIRREFLFEFIKWISSAPTSINMSDPDRSSTFINDLKNPDILKKKMSAITSLAISKMSIYLIREFRTVYNSESEDALYEYVSRQIMFYIRRVDLEITSMFETMKDVRTTDILKQYVVRIEAEIYKINNILIIDLEGESNEERPS